MPIAIQPDVIEVMDHTGGFSPDGVQDATDAATFPDVRNLLLDRNTGALQTRKGFRRLRQALEEETDGALITADHYIHQVFPFETDGVQYIICVVVKDAAEDDNVQLFAIDVNGGTVERFDTPSETWSNPTAYHWHQSIDSKLYGGSKGNPMWKWNGTTYNPSISTPNTKAWVDDTGSGVDTSTEYGRDYAWTGKELVSYSGDIFMPNKDIRYSDWEDGRHYQKFDRVSRKADGYYRSYRCTDTHVAVTADNAPDTGTDWNDVWDRVKLGPPQDEDGETQSNWAFVPEAAETSIAAWFADRLFLRFDGQGDNSRLQYSAPVKPDKGQDIANVSWDPNDWAPGNDFKGQGGGWLPFNDGKHGGAITALHSFGQYLIVFKRKSVWVLSGSDDTTWTVRRVARGVGAYGPLCVAEYDGLVYFLGDRGLYATDGTAAEEVPGNEKVDTWLKARIEAIKQWNLTSNYSLIEGIQPTLFRRDGFIGMTLPLEDDDDPYLTVFYDPQTESWWPTDIPAIDWAGYSDQGTQVQVFARSPADDVPLTLVYQYDHEDAGDEDDDGLDPVTYAGLPIAWYFRTAWLQFGMTREMRRIRRVWALLKGASGTDFELAQYRDYSTSASTTGTPASYSADTGYLEGQTMPDAHALQLRLDGDRSPAEFLGYAVHTQRRRSRYHA